jgi:UDP-N-acetylglucosamine--N-acetylmuramyl-(pentapeptide) pyrophosphoryl-undecaprenol N-acetylglucosamine transferase
LIKKIIITGTHLTPAVELINQLKADDKYSWDIYYIARQYNSSVDRSASIESQIIPNLGIKFYSVSCGKLDRRWLPNTLKGIPHTIKGLFEAFKLVSKIKPDVVVSFGGYVSVPVVISSWLKGIPSITHEQTLTNSLTTKINSYFVKKVALSFDNDQQKKSLPTNKVVVTGNLLRSEIFNNSSKTFEKLFGVKVQKSVIYVTAGNQGSHSINSVIKELLSKLENYIVIHQTGKVDFDDFKKLNRVYKNYFPFAYIELDDIGWIFKHSQIFISRAGANTSQEIVALNKNNILIPLPKSQQNEQKLNAAWVKNQLPENTIVIPQEKLNAENLFNSIEKLSKVSPPKVRSDSFSRNLKLLSLIHEII